MKSDNKSIPNKGFTHANPFHADDVFSTALLKLLNPNIQIERGFIVPESYDGIIYDIGLGEFDHHQKDNEKRKNDIPYASLGKLWRAFGNRLVSEKGVEEIDKLLIQSLDDSDNTGTYNALSIAISNMNITWDKKEGPNEAFNKAVNLASELLENVIESQRSKELAEQIVLSAIEEAANKEIVVLPYFVPSIDYLIDTDAKFVIFPSNRGGYNIQVIPKEHGNQAAKIDMPSSWAGETELDKKSNIETLTFCHVAKFLAATSTLNDAIKVAVTALNKEEKYSPKFDTEVNKIFNAINKEEFNR